MICKEPYKMDTAQWELDNIEFYDMLLTKTVAIVHINYHSAKEYG